jgi:hypothetical protein
MNERRLTPIRDDSCRKIPITLFSGVRFAHTFLPLPLYLRFMGSSLSLFDLIVGLALRGGLNHSSY